MYQIDVVCQFDARVTFKNLEKAENCRSLKKENSDSVVLLKCDFRSSTNKSTGYHE